MFDSPLIEVGDIFQQDISITAMESKVDLYKYLVLAEIEDIYIIRNKKEKLLQSLENSGKLKQPVDKN